MDWILLVGFIVYPIFTGATVSMALDCWGNAPGLRGCLGFIIGFTVGSLVTIYCFFYRLWWIFFVSSILLIGSYKLCSDWWKKKFSDFILKQR